jgi:hypothetical protein
MKHDPVDADLDAHLADIDDEDKRGGQFEKDKDDIIDYSRNLNIYITLWNEEGSREYQLKQIKKEAEKLVDLIDEKLEFWKEVDGL